MTACTARWHGEMKRGDQLASRIAQFSSFLVSLCWVGSWLLAGSELQIPPHHQSHGLFEPGPRARQPGRDAPIWAPPATPNPLLDLIFGGLASVPALPGGSHSAQGTTAHPPICTTRSGGGVTGHPTQAFCQPLPILVSLPSHFVVTSSARFVSLYLVSFPRRCTCRSLTARLVVAVRELRAPKLNFKPLHSPRTPSARFLNHRLRTPRSACKIEFRARRDKPRSSKQRRHYQPLGLPPRQKRRRERAV